VGRDTELTNARAALAGDAAGLVVSGASGVGKTRFADEVLADLAGQGTEVVRLLATRAAATIPFGAAATLLGDDASELASAQEPPTLAALQDAVTRRAEGRPLVVGVDDAHLLDEATARLVHHLADPPRSRVLLTVRLAEPAPRPVDALRHGGRCQYLELQPLTRDHVTMLLEAALGSQVEGHSADTLWQVTAGNVLFLRELCRDALDRGTLRRQHEVWTWTGDPILGARLQELLDSRLGQLSDAEHEAVALLALGEPLPRCLVAEMASPEAVERLIDRGLVTSHQAPDDPTRGSETLRLSHPLYGEGLRSRLGPLETADLYARLAGGLAAAGPPAPGDRLRIAVWSVTSGRPVDPNLLVAAARDALTRGDGVLAERLARGAATTFPGALVWGEALAALRRGREAEAVLGPLEPQATMAATRVAVCVARLAAHRSGDLPLEEAHRVAAHALATLEDDDDRRDLIDAALAETLADRGQIWEAGVLALPLLESPNAAARAVAFGPASTWLVHSGRADEAVVAGRAALGDALQHRHGVPWGPGRVVGHLGTALLTTGRLDELAVLCEQARTGPLAPTGAAQGVVALLQGAEALLRGRPATARGVLREAVLSFERTAGVGRRARALALLVEAEALLGEIASAEATLAALPPAPAGLADVDRQRAELCVLAARGDAGQAADRAVDLMELAVREDHPFLVLAMAYMAMRFGAVEVASCAEIVASEIQGALAGAFGQHGAALARQDAGGLEEASAALAALGCQLLAAEALVHAALAHQRDGRTARARAVAAQVTELRAGCEGARTPLLSQGGLIADLTPREREVALLAAGGMTSREISDQLGVSVRTVDNQLGRIYAKLGVAGRGELAGLLGL